MLACEQALDEFAELTAPGKTYAVAQLFVLAAQVTLNAKPGSTQGSVTLLCSGPVNGVSSNKIIDGLIDSGADVRIIDKTQAGRFLKSEEFEQKFKKIVSENRF